MGELWQPSNTIFMALIPKVDNPSGFQNFCPISLYNRIYKIISKIISRRLKDILSRQISPEQFGFLEGQQIHEAVGCPGRPPLNKYQEIRI